MVKPKEHEKESINANNKIINEITNSKTKDIESYPEYYAGSYLDDQGKLVICITDDNENIKKTFIDAAESSDLQFKKVDNSYKTLSELQDKITKIFDSSYNKYIMNDYSADDITKEMIKSITSISIVNRNNGIVVSMQDITDEKIDSFKKLFGDDDRITFENSGSSVNSTAWQPGRGIYNTYVSVTYRCSTGYSATYTNMSGAVFTGFVTCAHGYHYVGTPIYTDSSCSTTLGTVMVRMYSGSVDAAFVSINNANYSVSTSVYYGGVTIKRNSYVTELTEGCTIYKAGSTTGLTTAIVQSTNCTFTVDGTTFTNLVKTSKFCESGDSGGIVYYDWGSGDYITSGVVKGLNDGLFGLFSYSVFVKASEIHNNIGVRPY